MTSKIKPIVEAVKSRQRTARSFVEEALEKARAAAEYNSLLAIIETRSLERADEIDRRVAAGEDVGRLAGVPFIAKDNMLAFGAPTTAASRMLENFEAPFQATAIERIEAEGAICIGKSNLDAFAHGGSTENSAFGVTKNPVDPTRVAGGSSGGSAASVALDIAPFALGTDTGGSIRQPASFCGVVGHKPTYGTVSRYGVVAMASSTDAIGPLAHTAEDAALVMGCMAGRDSRDGTTLPDFFAPNETAEKLKIGIITDQIGEGVDPEVSSVTRAAADKMRSLGHEVAEISMPSLKYALAVYYIVVPAELSSNLARYDGIRYGLRAADVQDLGDVYEKSRAQGFENENKRRVLIGNYVLSSGYYDAYYQKAQIVRTKLINDYIEAFSKFDVLLSPTAPTPAFGIGENSDDPLKMYMADIMTVPPSLAGLPAVSVPFGASSAGLPIGVQLCGPQKSDATLLALAAQLEDK